MQEVNSSSVGKCNFDFNAGIEGGVSAPCWLVFSLHCLFANELNSRKEILSRNYSYLSYKWQLHPVRSHKSVSCTSLMWHVATFEGEALRRTTANMLRPLKWRGLICAIPSLPVITALTPAYWHNHVLCWPILAIVDQLLNLYYAIILYLITDWTNTSTVTLFLNPTPPPNVRRNLWTFSYLLQICRMSIARVSEGFLRTPKVREDIQECWRDVSEHFKEAFQGIETWIRGAFKEVSGDFKRSF